MAISGGPGLPPVVRVLSSALLPGFIGPESSVLPMDLPPSAPSPLRVRRSRFGFQSPVSTDWITQCPLSAWVDAPAESSGIEAVGLPGVRHVTSSYPVRLQLPLVSPIGYRGSLTRACSPPSGHPSSRFAVRYVHEFCLMLPPDGPSLEPPLPCWRSPSVRSRWLSFLQWACHARRTPVPRALPVASSLSV